MKPVPTVYSQLSRWMARLEGTRLLAIIALVIGLYVVVSTVIMVIDNWTPLPFWDQWENVISGREITWSWLISQHNEHRILFPRLIFIADRWLAGETNRVNLAVNIAIPAGLMLLIFRLAQGAGVRGRWESVWAAGLSLTLLFWSAQYENFVWGFQGLFFGVVLAAAGTFTALALGRATIAALVPVVVLEIVSVYTLSSGIVVPFLSVGLAIWLGRSRVVISVLTIVALALLGAYLVDYHTPSHHSDPLDVPRHLLAVATYMLVELGGPIGNTLGGGLGIGKIAVAGAAGAIGCAIFGFLGGTMSQSRRDDPPHQVALLALASFVVAMVFLTAAGRVRFGLEQALAARYATPAVAFWAALILLAAARSSKIKQWQTAVMGLVLPLQLLIALSEPHFAAAARLRTDGEILAIPAILANVADVQYLKEIYHDPLVPLKIGKILRSAHTSIFHDRWSDWLGTPLANHISFADAAPCQGNIDKVEQVADDPSPGWRAIGRAWSATPGKAPGKILIADETGKVVGYGIGGRSLRSLGIASPSQGGKNTGWVGAFAGASPESVVAYALVDGGAIACRLGPMQSVVSPAKLTMSDAHPFGLPYGGFIDSVAIGDGVDVDGWGFLQGVGSSQKVIVDTNLGVVSAKITGMSRLDVVSAYNDPRLADAGFSIRLELDSAAVKPKNVRLCVWTDDPVFGRHLLQNPVRSELCPVGGQ